MAFNVIKTGAVAAVALLAAPLAAAAADMRVPVYKGMPRSVISYYNWTGFYLGGTVGYAFGGASDWSVANVNLVSVDPKGMLYGVTAGYNWQAGSWVYGIEGDYSFSDVKGSGACPAPASCQTELSYLATFRGRMGYAFDRFMPYFTVGGAYGEVQASSIPVAISASDNKLGLAIGGGLEYAFLANWTVKGEYLYVDLGKISTAAAAADISFSSHIVRAGLNFKF
jgi:outer membrane immunogenic protein